MKIIQCLTVQLQNSPINYSISSYIQSPALLRKGSDAEGVITIGLRKTGRNNLYLQ